MKIIQVKIIVLLKKKYIVLTIKEEVLLKVDNDKIDIDNINDSNNYDVYKRTKITTQRYNNNDNENENDNEYELPKPKKLRREYSENVIIGKNNYILII